MESDKELDRQSTTLIAEIHENRVYLGTEQAVAPGPKNPRYVKS